MGRSEPFSSRLAALVIERRSQLVLGLDPDPGQLLPNSQDRSTVSEAVADHCRSLITAAGPHCVAVKPQLACFERLGAAGWEVVAQVFEAVRQEGLLVIADGKRGDVPHTAEAYAQAIFEGVDTPWGHIPGLGADAATVNPLLGRDSLNPFVEAAAGCGAGLFVLVHSSNPGAPDIQEQAGVDGPLFERIARLVDELGRSCVDRASGLSCVGSVVGATDPEPLARLRALMPHSIMLIPGVGAQGGQVTNLEAAFGEHPASALVTASRSIGDAHLQDTANPLGAVAAAAKALQEETWRVSPQS